MGDLLRSAQVRQVLRLFDELRELPPDGELRRRYALAALVGILHARIGTIVVVEDFRPHGRGRSTYQLESGKWDTPAERAQFVAGYSRGSAEDPAVECLMNRGDFRTCRREELIDDKTWYRSEWVHKYLRAANIDDLMHSTRPTARPDAVDGMSFGRAWGDSRFDVEDRNLLRLVHDELPSLLCPSPLLAGLPPRQRQTLELLCAGLSEKEIADELEVSPYTVHDYVKALYRRFGTHNRAELVLRYLGVTRGTVSSPLRPR